MELIPNDLILDIINCIKPIQLINICLTCKRYSHLLHYDRWSHTIILTNQNYIKYINSCYNFNKFIFINIIPLAKYFVNCHTINLSKCVYITDNDVIHFKNCHTLNLSECELVTDSSVKYLGKCNRLNLSLCKLITDNSVKYLGKCRKLNLLWCRLITDNSVKYLGKCCHLNLKGCDKITNLSIKYLGKCNRSIFCIENV